MDWGDTSCYSRHFLISRKELKDALARTKIKILILTFPTAQSLQLSGMIKKEQINFGNIVIMMSKFGSKSGDFAQRGPSTQIKLKNLIKVWSQDSNVTFLISSHDLAHTTEVCNRIVVLNKGELVRDIQTSPETLRDLEQYFADQISPSELV